MKWISNSVQALQVFEHVLAATKGEPTEKVNCDFARRLSAKGTYGLMTTPQGITPVKSVRVSRLGVPQVPELSVGAVLGAYRLFLQGCPL